MLDLLEFTVVAQTQLSFEALSPRVGSTQVRSHDGVASAALDVHYGLTDPNERIDHRRNLSAAVLIDIHGQFLELVVLEFDADRVQLTVILHQSLFLLKPILVHGFLSLASLAFFVLSEAKDSTHVVNKDAVVSSPADGVQSVKLLHFSDVPVCPWHRLTLLKELRLDGKYLAI